MIDWQERPRGQDYLSGIDNVSTGCKLVHPDVNVRICQSGNHSVRGIGSVNSYSPDVDDSKY